jgi:hypothetical protein
MNRVRPPRHVQVLDRILLERYQRGGNQKALAMMKKISPVA